MPVDEYEYYGKFKQDKFLNKYFFKDKKNGTFVDIGSYNGILNNNTWFFEKELNWEGICCEPLPNIFPALMNNRTDKSKNIECVVGEQNRIVAFTKNLGITELFSYVTDICDVRYKDRISALMGLKGGFRDIIKVKSHRLETIFDQIKVTNVDYISISTVGSELSVLKSINFDKVFVHIISFDNTFPDLSEDIVNYLKQKGFVFITNLGSDIFMIHEKSEFIPEDKSFKVEL